MIFFIFYTFILYLPLFPHSKHSEPRCPVWVLKRSTVGPFLWGIISFEHFLYNFFIYWWILTNLASKWPWERVLGENGLIILFGFKLTCVRTSASNPHNYLFCAWPHAHGFTLYCDSEYIFTETIFSQSFWVLICKNRLINKENI